MQRVWGDDFWGDSNVLEVFVANLRKTLEVDGEPRVIQTVRGVGYVLRKIASMNSERTRFFRSIRFRLTAWYAIILFIIILLLGAGVAKVLERQLRNDVDYRINSTAQQMFQQFQYSVQFSGDVEAQPPPPDSFSFPSQLIQVVTPEGVVLYSTQNLGERQIPTVPALDGNAGNDTIRND